MATDANKYAVPVDALVRSAHVPLEDQVEEHAEPPTPDLLSEQQREAQGLARVVGLGAFGATAALGCFDSDGDCD